MNHELRDDVVDLGALALRFGRVERATLHPDGARPETDTDHTVMLALLAPALLVRWRHAGLFSALNSLNLERVVSYAVVHDLVEAECGDTNSFGMDAQASADKASREAVALRLLCARFSKPFPWVARTLEVYELQQDPESRFIRYLDKTLPKITHALNGGAALKRMGQTPEQVREQHDKQIAELATRYPEFPMVDALLRDLCDLSIEALIASKESA